MTQLSLLIDHTAFQFGSFFGWLDRDVGIKALFVGLLPIMILLHFPVSWTGNEEVYFLLAHKRVSPEEFSPFHAAFNHSNARFLFEYLLGLLIDFLGYDWAHIIARITTAVAYSLALSIFFSALNLSVLRAIATIALFYFSGQHLLGHEWLFGGVESKTFAYAAVISALGFGIRGRWLLAATLLCVATYFHFLVGGFWIIGLSLLALLQTNSVVLPLRMLAFYAIFVLPLAIVILADQLGPLPQIIGLTPDQIYAIRAPHHIAPFLSKWQLRKWTNDIVATIGMTIAFFVLSRRMKDSVLPQFVFLLLVYLLIAIVLSFIDRNTYFFGKFYLFRPSSLTLLLSITTVFSIETFKRKEIKPYIITPLIVILITIFLWTEVKAKMEDFVKDQALADFASLVYSIEKESKPGEIVLIQQKNEMGYPYVGLPRSLPRPTLVSWKFVPANPRDLLRWYDLIEFRKTLFEQGCKETLPYPIKLLLIFDDEVVDNVKNCGEIVWGGDDYSLLKVKKEYYRE